MKNTKRAVVSFYLITGLVTSTYAANKPVLVVNKSPISHEAKSKNISDNKVDSSKKNLKKKSSSKQVIAMVMPEVLSISITTRNIEQNSSSAPMLPSATEIKEIETQHKEAVLVASEAMIVGQPQQIPSVEQHPMVTVGAAAQDAHEPTTTAVQQHSESIGDNVQPVDAEHSGSLPAHEPSSLDANDHPTSDKSKEIVEEAEQAPGMANKSTELSTEVIQRLDQLSASLAQQSSQTLEIGQPDQLKTIFENSIAVADVELGDVDDGRKIIEKIIEQKLIKDEFETETQYQARVQDVGQRLGYFITMPEDQGFTYNPESGKFSIKQKLLPNYTFDGQSSFFNVSLIDYLKVAKSVGVTHQYSSMNAELNFQIKNAVSNNPKQYRNNYIVGEYSLAPNMARFASKDLRILFMGLLDMTKINTIFSDKAQVLNNSATASQVKFLLPFELSGLYLYNIKNKQIVAPLTIRSD